MRITAHSLRRIIAAVILLLFVTVALWWGLWTLAAAQFHASIDRWIATARAAGYSLTYDGRESFGFPHHVILRFNNLNWKNTDGIDFHADQMDLSSLPWDQKVFDARFRGHVELTAPLDADNRTLTLGGEQGDAHVVLDDDGVWKESRVELSHATIGRAPDFLFHADRLAASAERPTHPPADHNETGLRLTGEAQNVMLPADMPAPFGPKMALLQASLRVMGEVPDFRRHDSVAAWNNAMGVVEFDNLHMEWGVLHLVAKGTLGFDDDLQPEGAFSSVIGNQSKVLAALAKQGFIPARRAGMLQSSLALFAKPAPDKSGIEVPITIQLEGLFLGPVRIFVFPEIEWPKTGAPDKNAPAAASGP